MGGKCQSERPGALGGLSAEDKQMLAETAREDRKLRLKGSVALTKKFLFLIQILTYQLMKIIR